MTVEYVSFQGRGPVRIAPNVNPDNLRRMGNNSQLEFAVNENTIEQQDFESEAGGLADSQSIVQSVTAGINILHFTPENFALGLRGSSAIMGTGAQTDEAHYGWVSDLVLLDYNPDPDETVTVAHNVSAWTASTAVVASSSDPSAASWAAPTTPNNHVYKCTTAGTTDASEPTWPTDGSTVADGTAVWTDMGVMTSLTEGTDFSVSRSGITVAASGKIVDGVPLKISYTPDSNTYLIQALVNSGSEYRMVFDGMNFAKTNRACTVICHRVKFTPTTGVPFISENYGEMPLSAQILKDDTITTSGLSQYFGIRWKAAA